MADSKIQKQCEVWIVDHWLSKKYSRNFNKKKLKMQNRGVFEFDAVDSNDEIVANISTASSETHRGKRGSGKLSKLRADCLMLSLVDAKIKMMLLTENSMFNLALKEQNEGRLPIDIIIVKVDLPSELTEKLALAQRIASEEVRGHEKSK